MSSRRHQALGAWAVLAWCWPFTALADGYNMTRGVTDFSQRVYGLHMTIFWICCAIGAVVFGLLFYSLIRHRKSRGAKAANFHESTRVEILWTLIPFVILIAMAVPATKALVAGDDDGSGPADITVQVTGSQWKWHYQYLGTDVGFYSLLATLPDQITNRLDKGDNYLLEVDRPLVLPTGRNIRFVITSEDVIHSWWVPAFAVKKDAVPGFINQVQARIKEPGLYRGQCAELCGKDHGFMPIVVIAKTPAAFDDWLSAEQARLAAKKAEEQKLLAMNRSLDELMRDGKALYEARCAMCHQPNGEGLPGAIPALKGSAIATGDVHAHIDIVLNGKAGTAMQAFGKQLSLSELAAIITYERNAWGNSTGDAVQAADLYRFLNGDNP
ncbi:cytochrome c oxidase subunit II [Gallaecimonas pentaromativorans]|uniref:cytochrome c oxidase subunit II n=1 Tax=Gallaecimonas pentaromativorans TaxID=584787 RepID=UPI003A946D4B